MANVSTPRTPFWEKKMLEEMTRAEWESLCDNCGRCCLEKLENRKTGKVYFTSVCCRFLDPTNCTCTAYHRRKQAAPWCLTLTPAMVPRLRWLPKTCAYRMIAEKRALAWWHPLLSGSPDTVHLAGISVSGRVISAQHVHPDDLDNFIIDWKDWEASADGARKAAG